MRHRQTTFGRPPGPHSRRPLQAVPDPAPRPRRRLTRWLDRLFAKADAALNRATAKSDGWPH